MNPNEHHTHDTSDTNEGPTKALEGVYRSHHTIRRRDFHLVLGEERGAFLRERIGTGKKVLDVGCRDGALTGTYCEGNDVLGLDIDSVALDRAKAKLGIQVRQVDLNGEWGVEPNAYDAAVAAEVLEHLYYPGIVLDKIAAALKPGGIVVGSLPHAFSLQNRLHYLRGSKKGTPLQDPTHINHVWHADFRKLLEDRFDDVEVIGLVTKKFKLLSKILPFHFAHTLLFSARKRA